MSFDLSSTTLWQPQSGHPGLTPVERFRLPAMQAKHDNYNRVFTHRTFTVPVTIRFAFDWIASGLGDAPPQDNLGVVPCFLQDEEHGYYVTIRANGQFGASQEAYDYDGFGASQHDARPGDGVRHHVEVTFDVDGIRVRLDNTVRDYSYEQSKFTPLQVGRIGLRLDRQHIVIPSFVAIEGA